MYQQLAPKVGNFWTSPAMDVGWLIAYYSDSSRINRKDCNTKKDQGNRPCHAVFETMIWNMFVIVILQYRIRWLGKLFIQRFYQFVESKRARLAKLSGQSSRTRTIPSCIITWDYQTQYWVLLDVAVSQLDSKMQCLFNNEHDYVRIGYLYYNHTTCMNLHFKERR